MRAVPAQLQPAGGGVACMGPAHRPAQHGVRALALPAFHAAQAAVLQKLPKRGDLTRRTVGQNQGGAGLGGLAQRRACGSKLPRAELVVLGKCGVKVPGRAKTTGTRHMGHRQGAVLQPLFGVQQPLGLQVLQGRDLPMAQKQTPQVPVAHAQLRRQCRHARRLEALLNGRLQLLGRAFGQHRLGIGGGPKATCGGQFRATAQAGPEALCLGLSGCLKKAAVGWAGQSYAANWAAINAGGGHPCEKKPIPRRILVGHGLVTALRVQAFARSGCRGGWGKWKVMHRQPCYRQTSAQNHGFCAVFGPVMVSLFCNPCRLQCSFNS